MSRVGGHSVVLKRQVQQPCPQGAANRSTFGSLPKPHGALHVDSGALGVGFSAGKILHSPRRVTNLYRKQLG
jgi:hypothetical protein